MHSNGSEIAAHKKRMSSSPTNWHLIKSLKAKTNARRSPLEKVMDKLTRFFGSSFFLALNVLWFVVWIAWNTSLFPGFEPFDPFPFSFLTLMVSLEAIMLAIIVLISQNRAAKIADLREETALHIDIITEQELSKLMGLMVKLLHQQGIDVSKDRVLQEMLQPTDMNKIEKALERQLS